MNKGPSFEQRLEEFGEEIGKIGERLGQGLKNTALELKENGTLFLESLDHFYQAFLES